MNHLFCGMTRLVPLRPVAVAIVAACMIGWSVIIALMAWAGHAVANILTFIY